MASINQPATRRPNVVWIFGDQHRAQALGCHGDPNLHTPHIDRLAAEGLAFTAAVAGAPLCSPYRRRTAAGSMSGSAPGRMTPAIASTFRTCKTGHHATR